MKTVGFLISHKNNERRRALLPEDIAKIKHPEMLYFEKGYGETVGIPDEEYAKWGCRVVSREDVFSCDILTDVKLCDGDYLSSLPKGKTLFGWAHAVQGIEFTTETVKRECTVIAWEDITEKGRYIFYRNREIAGEAAILHAFRYCGKMPYDTTVAILGNGATAKGALRILHGLGAEVDVYGRKLEKLFQEKMYDYDVIVNCVKWDTTRRDRVIYKKDLQKMKKGTLIIDVSCNKGLEIETSHPTTIDDPVYTVDGVTHYVVDNVPAMFPVTVTKELSRNIAPYFDILMEREIEEYPQNLKDAIPILHGTIVSDEVRQFRRRLGIYD